MLHCSFYCQYKDSKTRWSKEQVVKNQSCSFSVHKVNGIWTIEMKYGYYFEPFKGREDDGTGYTVYDYHHPKEGDKWISMRNGRSFEVGKVEGFIMYHTPLYFAGTNKIAAMINFENYYKD